MSNSELGFSIPILISFMFFLVALCLSGTYAVADLIWRKYGWYWPLVFLAIATVSLLAALNPNLTAVYREKAWAVFFTSIVPPGWLIYWVVIRLFEGWNSIEEDKAD